MRTALRKAAHVHRPHHHAQQRKAAHVHRPHHHAQQRRDHPQLGFGVFQVPDEETTAAVSTALEAGYSSSATS
ncbi:hypothetical protein [Streptomyces sp. EN27]|uniref:hypothetical protein n=1 Tax=Streptomyces sp. EN27 TaxID=211464 RepID=UPI000AE3ED20|nr:hypothetical protein [Streptomyces sp. EN27]